MIPLNAPLVCLDVETTGAAPKVDRICQMAFLKFFPDGRTTEWQTLVNPTVPIPAHVSLIHHIDDEMVKDAPTFEAIAPRLAAALQKCDFLGYNLAKFDLIILAEEFKRVRARPEQILNGRIVDVYRLFQRYERRTLTDAVRRYLSEEHIGAHDAMADVRATARVFEAQLAAHDDLPKNVEDLHRLIFETPREGQVDPDGKIIMRGNDAYINFGNQAGKRLRDLDDGFLRWIIKGDFTPSVKDAVNAEIERRMLL